jgi:hypothetical protein
MPILRSFATALAAAALASACYRVTVVTGAAPAAKVVDKPWNNSFVIGLVPPPPVDVSKDCGASGVSQVVTQRSFLNGLVGVLTQNIYTPLQITATCAAGARSSARFPARRHPWLPRPPRSPRPPPPPRRSPRGADRAPSGPGAPGPDATRGAALSGAAPRVASAAAGRQAGRSFGFLAPAPPRTGVPSTGGVGGVPPARMRSRESSHCCGIITRFCVR